MFLKILLLMAVVYARSHGFILESYDRRDDELIENQFDVTHGCKQLNANKGYNAENMYYHVKQFSNVRFDDEYMKMRLGVLGDRNAYVRLAPIQRPYYSTKMHEIALSHGDESFLQSYVRTAADKFHDQRVFSKQNTRDLMSWFEPMMFTVEVYKGRLTVTREMDRFVFIDEIDQQLSSNFISFVNWGNNEKVVFFVDCPM